MTERDFSSAVEATLSLLGWRWSHFRAARTRHGWRTPLSGDQGFPDIVAVRDERLAFIEPAILVCVKKRRSETNITE